MTAAMLYPHTPRQKFSLCWKCLLAFAAGLLCASALNAQAPDFLSPNQSRPSEPGVFSGSQPGQYRVCTPDDYFDPDAECISPKQQQSAPYGDLDGYDYNNGLPSTSRVPFNQPLATPGDQSTFRPTYSPDNYSTIPSTYYEKEPPTEFQRYVATLTGKVLPIFGASLFEKVPATFAPVDRMPVGPDYRIAPGDELQITIWGQLNLTRRVLVDRLGVVTFPDTGPITMAGLGYAEATLALKTSLARLYKNFDVSVTLGRLHPIQVFVLGAARRPGSYTVGSLSTLVNAIFASGGPSPRGSMRSIQLKRGNTIVSDFDLYDLLLFGDKSKDVQLAPGDVIFIPPAGPRVALTGSVEFAAIYELKAGTNLKEVINLADGESPLASQKQISLERIGDNSALQVFTMSLDRDGLTTLLHNGDIVRILPVVPRFDNAVTLKGNVADAGRFPWREGMRLSDLIPDKSALLTRDYWNEQNALAKPEPSGANDRPERSDEPLTPGSGTPTPERTAPDTKPKPVAISYQEQQRNTRGDSSLAAATELDNAPPVRSFNPRNNVQPLAPEIDWQYAVLERMDKNTLETRKIAFNLGKLLLNHDQSQNLLLQPGDIVTIFSKADFSVPSSQQLKEVRIEGEVAMAGVYSVAPGETLRQIVLRAGGLTTNAYLYGAQFTRESTRREQQKRYQDFLNDYERQSNQAAANLSSRVVSPQQAATAQASLGSQRELIENLRKISMNGRIVLDINPQAKGVHALPDLPLENGDRLYIPSRPLTVNVMGNVFEQTSFIFQEDFRTGDYLKKAGGPTRDADRGHTFVIRADGSVVSKSFSSPLFAKSFESLQVYPGDTIVVPTLLNRSTLLRSLTDWTQVFANFGLGAAAVNVLR